MGLALRAGEASKFVGKQVYNVKVIFLFSVHAIRSHEYLKHGTCCTGISCLSTEHDYFSTVLDLFEQHLNYGEILDSHGVKPSNTTTYEVFAYSLLCGMTFHDCRLYACTMFQVEQFNNAFKDALGVRPLLQCYYSKVSGY